MKELFYIKGDPIKYFEVKKALLNKYPNAHCGILDFKHKEFIYYLDCDNYIDYCRKDNFLGDLIKFYGTEIKLEDNNIKNYSNITTTNENYKDIKYYII